MRHKVDAARACTYSKPRKHEKINATTEFGMRNKRFDYDIT